MKSMNVFLAESEEIGTSVDHNRRASDHLQAAEHAEQLAGLMTHPDHYTHIMRIAHAHRAAGNAHLQAAGSTAEYEKLRDKAKNRAWLGLYAQKDVTPARAKAAKDSSEANRLTNVTYSMGVNVNFKRKNRDLEESVMTEAENLSKKSQYDRIAKTLDRYIRSKKYDSHTMSEMQSLNDLCVLASHHIVDANEFASRAKSSPQDRAAQKEAADIGRECEKLCELADKKISRLTPVLAAKGIHI